MAALQGAPKRAAPREAAPANDREEQPIANGLSRRVFVARGLSRSQHTNSDSSGIVQPSSSSILYVVCFSSLSHPHEWQVGPTLEAFNPGNQDFLLVTSASLLGTKTLLGAPGRTTSNKKQILAMRLLLVAMLVTMASTYFRWSTPLSASQFQSESLVGIRMILPASQKNNRYIVYIATSN